MKESISCLADALSMLEREREGDRETETETESRRRVLQEEAFLKMVQNPQ